MAEGGSGSDLKSSVLGMGNPLLDISAEVPPAFLEKYGVKPADAILAEEAQMPIYEEMSKEFPVKYIAGGATLNTIRVCQWMTGVEGATCYVGCVGEDDYGERMERAATADGVRVLFRKESTVPTGTCAVLITDKERSMVANLAAANAYKLDHFESEAVQGALGSAKVVYSAGFFLTVCPDAMVKAGEACAASAGAKKFCLNLSAPFLCQFFKDPMMRVMPFADVVFGNESEAAAFAEAHGLEDASLSAVALHIAALPKAAGATPRTVIFTHGSEATVVARNGKVETFDVPAVPKDDIVDLNGAGDAFVGGFLSRFVQGKPLKECVDAGHWAAGVIIRTSGTTLPAKCDYEA